MVSIDELIEGQLWQLGRHSLWVGDALRFSLFADHLERHCSWQVDLVLTDPPFSLVAELVQEATIRFSEQFIITGCGLQYHRLCTLSLYRYHFEIINQRVTSSKRQSGNQEPQFIHWNNAFLTLGSPHCFDRSLASGAFLSVQPADLPEIEGHYSKPLSWAVNLLLTCHAETICDPFVGTGTVLLACEQVGKTCRAIESDLHQCYLTLTRWQAMTGQEAALVF